MIVNADRDITANLGDLGFSFSSLKSAGKSLVGATAKVATAPIRQSIGLTKMAVTSPLSFAKKTVMLPATLTSSVVSQGLKSPTKFLTAPLGIAAKLATSPMSFYKSSKPATSPVSAKGILSTFSKPTTATDMRAAALQVVSSDSSGGNIFSKLGRIARSAPSLAPAPSGVTRAPISSYTTTAADSDPLAPMSIAQAAVRAMDTPSASSGDDGVSTPSAVGGSPEGAEAPSSFIDKIPGGKLGLVAGGLGLLGVGWFLLRRRGGGATKS